MNSSPNSERSRLARELHDGLAQELAAVGYQLDQVVGDPALDNKNRRIIRDIRFTLSGIINQVRDEIFQLRTESIKSFDQVISEQAESILFNTSIKFEVSGQIEISSAIKFELVRVIRELIINAKRHANCAQVKIELLPSQILVTDDGIGGIDSKEKSYGLIGVRERLHLIGAELDVDYDSKGTKIGIRFNP